MSVMADVADIPYSATPATGRAEAKQETQKFAEAALANSKREGLLLAIRARWVALAVTAINVVMGTVIAWVLVRDDFRGKRLVNTLIDLPFARAGLRLR